MMSHPLPRLVAAAAPFLMATMVTADPGAGPQQTFTRFRGGTDVVRVAVTARDAQDRIVADLKPEEFEVYEDGVRQTIGPFGHAEVPISVVVLLDTSFSMVGDKLMHAKDGVTEFSKALKADDEVLVIAFADAVQTVGAFGLDARRIERAVRRVRASGQTRLYDAVLSGAQEISAPERKEKTALFVLSDGADTASFATLDEAVEAVRMAEVSTYAIAIEYGMEGAVRPMALDPRGGFRRLLSEPSDARALYRLTDGTGGWTYPIQAAKRCKDICLRVADELRNQYLLGYTPTNREQDGRWRAIDVRTTRPGVAIAARNGYFAPRGL